MHLHITQRRIDKGEGARECKCPVALSMIAAGIERPSVGPRRCHGYISDELCLFRLGEEARSFVYAFDTGHNPAPAIVEIFPVEEDEYNNLAWAGDCYV